MDAKEFDRFRGYVDVVHTPGTNWVCWEWLGKKCHRGYGRFWYRGQWRQAHRYSYMYLNRDMKMRQVIQEIPEDRPELNHRCCNRACVRPSHLEPVTHQENHDYRSMIYWQNKKKTLGGRK
jgi:hypothetical protein